MPTTNRVRLTIGLIEQAIRNPPVIGKTTFLRDSQVPGLALRIHPTGRATYTLLLPKGERKKLMSLQLEGRLAPEWWKGHLKRVREIATEELVPYRLPRTVEQAPKPRQVRDGTDEYHQAGSTKIEAVARRFTREHFKGKARSSARQCESRLKRYVLPEWKGRDVREITRKDVRELVQGIEKRGLPSPANLTLSNLKTMFNWCIDEDLLEQNPASRVKKPGVERARDRWLSDRELALVWHGAGYLPYPWGPWYRLLVLMPNRRTELAGMRWAEIDRDQAIWTIPAARTKSRRAHVVPLTTVALQILDGIQQTGPWVFSTTQATPIQGFTWAKRRLDAWLAERVEKIEPWHNHDLRRTGKTGMSRLKVAPHVKDAVLSHARPGMDRIYDMYDYLDEKRDALDKWARHVLAITERYKPAPTTEEMEAEARRYSPEEVAAILQRQREWNRQHGISEKSLEEAMAQALGAVPAEAAGRR